MISGVLSKTACVLTNLMGLSTLILCCGIGTARADVPFGVISTVEVASGNGPSTFPNQIVNFTNGGNPVPVTSYTSPILSASGSYTVGTSAVSGSGKAWDTLDNTNGVPNLHGYAAASISGVCQTCQFFTENGSLFNLNFYDKINFGGLANGTPEDFLFTAALNSSISAPSGQSSAYAAFELPTTQAIATNTGGASNGLIIQSIIVHTVSGAILPTVIVLNGDAEVNNNYPVNNLTQSESATVDASDTGNFYITALTPGASYTSASGLGYSQAPSQVPEPASLGLVAGVFFAILVGMRKRLRS
jgi:hypothetical protein